MRGYKHRFLSWQKVRVLPPGLQSLVARTLSDNDYIHNFIQSSLLMNGYGCKSDHHKALEYLRRAGESGHAIGTAYMYRLHVSCGVDDIPGWDTRKKLSDAAKIGSRAAMNDLQDLDPQMALTAKKWLAFTAGGVGSDWYDRVNMLHGLTQADLMNDAKFLAQAQAAEDVNSFRVNQRGDTLLHFAAACGREVSIVTLIKQFSANVEVTNNAGDTPLICACRSGHGRIVAYFLKLCNANTKVVTHNGETPAHWLIQFDDSGAELLAKDLLSQGANVNSQTNIRISHSTFPGTVDCDFQVPGTPLSWAVHDNKLNAVRALLSNGADPQVAMLEGRSALEWAAHYHHHECLGIMIAHIERLHEQDASNDNRNDKRFALRYGPLVSAAIKAADKFSMILRNGKEYLHRLHSTLDLLREKITMITFSKQIDWVNQSFLYYAVSNGYDEVVEYMLKNNWLDQKIDEKNGDFQRTPLLEAVRWNRRSMVDLLIEHGADVYACATNPYQPSETGWTALHVLAEEGHNDDEALELASYLISLGVRVDSRSTREASGAWTQGAVVGSAKVATSNLSTGDANDLAQDAAPAPTMIGANGLAQAVSDSPSIDVAGRSTTKDTIQSTTYVASKSASDKTAVDVIKGGSGPSIEAADGFAMVAEDGPTTKADTQSPSIPAKETGTRSFSTEDVISSSLHSFKLSSPSELKSQSPQSSFTTTEVPLSVALRYNSFRFATRLIFLGASPNALSLSASLFSTPHPTTILGHIITTNARYSRDRLSFLLSHPGIDFIVEPTRGLTALHRAAMAEDGVRFIDTDRAVERHEFDDGTNEEITRILLGRWGNSKEMGALTRDGQTALMLATEHGNVGVVRALLDAGADRTMQDDVGRTAKDIARALRSEVAERIRRLLEEA
ncbi:ankyrin [Myriangium duriaei CBS 260.36]|uniref:Ankyrin n=1 Tax=Myriangium duriaei CBS 260.36 TaxID=1168546 RepID=A0A9P4MC45_9PEZI|nr:ankyrin [Myriangium duriaei CBS 260.36]